MATYTGPTASPVFVTGIVNDSWAQAVALTQEARAAVQGLDPTPLDPQNLDAVDAPLDLAVTQPPLQVVNLDPEESLTDELTNLLRAFIADHYPAVAIPDASEAWLRITNTFDGDPLRLAGNRVRDRIDSSMAARGFTLDPQEREFLLREHDREAASAQTGSARNTEIAYKSGRKSVQITQYETALKAHRDALEAARAFLLQCVLAAQSRVADEQRIVANFKRAMQDTFWRLMNAKIEANTIELDRLILEKRISLEADLSDEERKTLVFQQLVRVAIDECQSIARQASAAINRISAAAGVSGIERTP